jgi:enoyl-CoA hydratase
MGSLVNYEFDGSIATITMDDGKVNVLSLAMLTEIGEALDRAEADHAIVVLTGREGRFSGGFDLATIQGGGTDAIAMLRAGFETAERLLGFPTPVLIACPGHAVAMGVFMLLSGDYRIGCRGSFKITANEVAIGMPMPRAAIEVCRQRLTPAAFTRAVILAEVFAPDDAVAAGFLDRVVAPEELAEATRSTAELFTTLDARAHVLTKRSARAELLTALRAAIEADQAELLALL